MSRAIYLSNSANQDFQAIAIPAGSYHCSDLWSAEVCLTWNKLNINNSEEFYNWYKNSASGLWTPELAKIISLFFDNFSTKISAGESKELFKLDKPNEYFNPLRWSDIKNNSSWLIFLRSKDGKWTCAYNSCENSAWIIQGKNQGYEAIQAKANKVWQSEAGAKEYYFVQVKTNASFQRDAKLESVL